MSRILTFLFLVLTCAASRGNPLIITHPAYISSERLEVKVLGDVAEIDGRFHFRSTVQKGSPEATVHVPFLISIWVPSDPDNADPATAALLRFCEPESEHRLKDDSRAAWDAAIGLKVTVGKRPVEIESFSVSDMRSKKDRESLPSEWRRKGFYRLSALLHFKPDWLREDPEIRVQYRQGLCRTRAGNLFHYVPFFFRLPETHTTRDLDKYAMHLTNASSTPATLGSISIPSGYSAILPLAHYVPISITLTR